MTTQHLFRLILIIPALRQAAFNTWWKANLDAAGGDKTFTTGLNATGAGAPTHYWMNGAFTVSELKIIMRRLANLSGVVEPATWDSMTRAQKFNWFRNNKPSMSGIIVDIEPMPNDGIWLDPQEVLTRAGLKTIEPVLK